MLDLGLSTERINLLDYALLYKLSYPQDADASRLITGLVRIPVFYRLDRIAWFTRLECLLEMG